MYYEFRYCQRTEISLLRKNSETEGKKTWECQKALFQNRYTRIHVADLTKASIPFLFVSSWNIFLTSRKFYRTFCGQEFFYLYEQPVEYHYLLVMRTVGGSFVLVPNLGNVAQLQQGEGWATPMLFNCAKT